MLPCPIYYPYEIIKYDPTVVVIKLNPPAYKIQLKTNEVLSKQGVISFNTNYSWKSKPIGYAMDKNNFSCNLLNPKYDLVRPCLCFDNNNNPRILEGKIITKNNIKKFNLSIVIQAGPTLVRNSKIDIKLKEQIFRSDVARRTRQLSIGITKANKLVIIYSSKWALKEIAEQFIKYDCEQAIKLDGGHMAALKFAPLQGHNKASPIFVGNKGKTVLQLSFTHKKN